MFQPSQHDVRRFFCETRRKQHQGLPLDATAPQLQARLESYGAVKACR